MTGSGNSTPSSMTTSGSLLSQRPEANRREFLVTGGPLAVFTLNYFLREPARRSDRTELERQPLDIPRLRDHLGHLRRLDAERGFGALLNTSRAETAALFRVLPPDTSEQDRRELLMVAADSASFTGWLEFDTGNEARAQHYLTLGLRAARQVGDPISASTAFAFMAIQQYNLCNWDEALILSRAARRTLDGLDCPHVIATHWTREARASAGKGEASGCDAALAAAFDSFAAGPGDDHPESVDWVTLGELHGQAAGCAALLGDVDRARGHIEAAVSSYGDGAARSSSLHLLRLALAYAEVGAFTDASATAGDASIWEMRSRAFATTRSRATSFTSSAPTSRRPRSLRSSSSATKKLTRKRYPQSVRGRLHARAS